MRKFLKNVVLIFYYIIQLLILIVSFFACTSVIEVVPWYEPLTMGAAFLLMYVFPLQLFISIVLSFLNVQIIPKTFNRISHFTTFIIVFNIIILSSNSYIIAIIIAIIEMILFVWFIITVIKQFLKIKNNRFKD